MKHLIPALLAAFALSTAATAQVGPPPSTVAIRSVEYWGTACPPGTAVVSISSDQLAFSAVLSQFSVESQDPRGVANKACDLRLNIAVPPGWTYAINGVDVRGYAQLDQGATGLLINKYRFISVREPVWTDINSLHLAGPYDSSFDLHGSASLSERSWFPCTDAPGDLIIDTTTVVQGAGLVAVDSIDGDLKLNYRFSWRQCSPQDRPRCDADSTLIGGECWRLSGWQTSCEQACANHGGVNLAATARVAGSDAECARIGPSINEFEWSGSTAACPSAGMGCFVSNGADLKRCVSSPFNPRASAPQAHVICSCTR